MTELVDYESMVIEKFTNDPELCREMVRIGISEYFESGEEKNSGFIVLNLGRIIKARGYEDFITAGLSRRQIDDAVQNNEGYDPDVINKMLEALGIEERIT